MKKYHFMTILARKSRWGSESDKAVIPGQIPVVTNPSVAGKSPELVSYAMKVFGSVDLEEHQWKQCQDQLKVQIHELYNVSSPDGIKCQFSDESGLPRYGDASRNQ